MALWLLVTLTSFFALSATANTAHFINIGLLSASALLHGSKQHGETIIVSFMLVVLFTNLFDNMTVVTAYPFGALFSENRGVTVGRPIVEASLTTSWDLYVDAIGGTVNRDWIWSDRGPWFGVPWKIFSVRC